MKAKQPPTDERKVDEVPQEWREWLALEAMEGLVAQGACIRTPVFERAITGAFYPVYASSRAAEEYRTFEVLERFVVAVDRGPLVVTSRGGVVNLTSRERGPAPGDRVLMDGGRFADARATVVALVHEADLAPWLDDAGRRAYERLATSSSVHPSG